MEYVCGCELIFDRSRNVDEGSGLYVWMWKSGRWNSLGLSGEMVDKVGG